MKHERYLREHPVFTGENFAAYLASRGGAGPRARESLLAYYRRTGRVLPVRRGLYAVVPRGVESKTYSPDPFLVAAKASRDGVLSYHTALEAHGHAYSVREQFVYCSSRPASRFTFQGRVFRGVRGPESLRRAGREEFGVVAQDRSGLQVRVTSLERTMVDVLSRPELSGGWDEIWRSLESVAFFDLDLVVAYVSLLGNATTAAKTGYFLERHRDALMVEDEHLQQLRKLRPRQPHYLDRSRREPGRLIPGWNLVVSEEALEPRWAEVA